MKGCIIEANLEQPGQVVNNIAYQFFGSNLRVDIFLKTKEHQKKGALKQKTEVSLYTMYWGFIPFPLCTFVLAKILQNVDLTPGFKNHMGNLANFRQVVESPKS